MNTTNMLWILQTDILLRKSWIEKKIEVLLPGKASQF